MSNKESPVNIGAGVLGADGAALAIEHSARALKSGIARLEEDQIKLEVLDGSLNNRERFKWVRTVGYELMMQPRRNDPDCFECIHGSLTILGADVVAQVSNPSFVQPLQMFPALVLLASRPP